MVPATFVGMALALGSLITMMLLEGSSPLAVVLLPPLILVFGATFGAAVAGSTIADVRKLGSWFRMAFGPERASPTHALVAQLVELATVARKEGMLPLENRARSVEDPFLRRGLQLTIDGTKYVVADTFDHLLRTISDHRAAVLVERQQLYGGVAEIAEKRPRIRLERRARSRVAEPAADSTTGAIPDYDED